MGRKKKSDFDAAFDAEFELLDAEGNLIEREEEPPAAAEVKTKKKKDKKGKGKKAAAFNSDDEEPSLPVLPTVVDEEEEEEDDEDDEHLNLVAPKGKSKKKAPTSVFALLGDEGDDIDDDIDDEEEGEEDVEEEKPCLRIAEIMSVDPHPKADRLKVCRVDGGPAGIVTVVTNALTVEEGQLVVLAPVGCVTPGSGITIEKADLRGVESHGMLCSAYDIGWSKSPDGVLVVLPDDLDIGEPCPDSPPEGTIYGPSSSANNDGTEDKKKKKKKSSSKDVASAFAALAVDDDDAVDAEEEETAPKKSKKKSSKKSAVDTDSLFAALTMDEGEAAGGDDEEKKSKKKKKKSTAADVDIDALLAAVEEDAAPVKKESKSKKGKSKSAAPDEEDIDALLAQIDGPSAAPAPAPAPAAAAGGKKDKKKKGKGGAKEEEEDLDAILAELGMDAPPPPSAATNTSAPAAAAAPVVAEGDDDGEAEGEGGEKEMSAAAKKKAKKKAKEKAKKQGEEGGDEAADSAAPAGGAGGKKQPKVSAAVKRMQEAVEAKRRAEEEAARLAEEQQRQEEEEERRLAEEEERKKADAERRKAEKAARREQLKKEGKLLTGKAKAEAERLARVREQLLKQAGVDPDAIVPKKKPVYSNKKKAQPKKKEETPSEQAEQQQEASEAVAAPVPEPVKEEAPPPEETGTAAAAEPESWEEAADDWEAIDEDEIPIPVISKDEEDAEEKAAKAKAAAAAAAAQEKKKVEEGSSSGEESGSDEEESESGDESSSDEDGSSSDDDSDSSSEYSSSEEDSSEDSEDEMEARVLAAREKRDARLKAALAERDPTDLRSPICCILGHVDTGKTKILDNIRRTNVQDGEAGGITQQIGATYIPGDAVVKRTEELRKGRAFDLKLPGLLVIDTPGHESFSNLRSRGSGLCDIAVLVVDLMHGLEQQTIESINLLRMRKTPFIIAMNKVDRLYGWKSVPNSPIQDAFERQDAHTTTEFEQRSSQVMLELNEQGLNVALYWKNKDPRSFINIVPTSAITGEGIPDLLQLLVKLTQSLMAERLMFVNDLECTVLEVKQIEGLGTTIDVVLVNGMLKEGDTIVVCGLNGPIVTSIRALLTPQPLREMRVKGTYVHHKELRAAMGVKIAAHNLETAVAGTQLYVVQEGDDLEAIKEEVMEDMDDIFASVDRSGEGVCVQASTLGSLEALLEFLRTPEVDIPVAAINIGPIHKKDIMRANVMIERKNKKYGVILAFDVTVDKEARELAEDLGVKIFTADIIYHLFDAFTNYLKQMKEEEREAAKQIAVFPCVLDIIQAFNKKDPLVLGVQILEGVLKVGTPVCVPGKGGIDLGRVTSIEKEHKNVDTARVGDLVAIRIESTKPEEASRLYGRHFDDKDQLVSRITRKSIDSLKEVFRDQMTKDDWKLVIKLKKLFRID